MVLKVWKMLGRCRKHRPHKCQNPLVTTVSSLFSIAVACFGGHMCFYDYNITSAPAMAKFRDFSWEVSVPPPWRLLKPATALSWPKLDGSIMRFLVKWQENWKLSSEWLVKFQTSEDCFENATWFFRHFDGSSSNALWYQYDWLIAHPHIHLWSWDLKTNPSQRSIV